MPGSDARGATIEGVTDAFWPGDRMVITMARPCPAFGPHDTLIVRSPDGDELDLSFAGLRPDGRPSVWYAINPLLRHWLGWLEKIDDTHWMLRMEPFHLTSLDEAAASGPP